MRTNLVERREMTKMNNKILEHIGLAGLVPVVVIEDSNLAVNAAQALLDGGLDVMEITLRTEGGLPSIKAVSEAFPEMVVGAGTVLNLEQAKASVEAGAKFIVSPGYNPELVKWCKANGIPITPGCVTPSEIETAMKDGLDILKFFPANVYGGINGCKALAGPYGNIKFVPTGGISLSNLSDFADKDFIHAVGGGWLCASGDIKAGNLAGITEVVRKSIDVLLGFELVHVGINSDSDSDSAEVANLFQTAFGFVLKEGSSSRFAGKGIEVNKFMGIGDHGHIAIRTNSIARAVHYLEKRGFEIDKKSEKTSHGKVIVVYLKEQMGGFGVHLLKL